MANQIDMVANEFILRLHGQGVSNRRIARLLQLDRGTVARCIRLRTDSKPAGVPAGIGDGVESKPAGVPAEAWGQANCDISLRHGDRQTVTFFWRGGGKLDGCTLRYW